jgi:N6-adenosine-specific RNA methylase IME4
MNVPARRLPQPFPLPRHGAVLADPPWELGQVGGNRGAVHHYSLMSIEEIAALPIASVVADNAHLWLWSTSQTLFAAEFVMEAWGFKYRGILTWIKPRLGAGWYLRNQTEHLMLGTRGKAPLRFRVTGDSA